MDEGNDPLSSQWSIMPAVALILRNSVLGLEGLISTALKTARGEEYNALWSPVMGTTGTSGLARTTVPCTDRLALDGPSWVPFCIVTGNR